MAVQRPISVGIVPAHYYYYYYYLCTQHLYPFFCFEIVADSFNARVGLCATQHDARTHRTHAHTIPARHTQHARKHTSRHCNQSGVVVVVVVVAVVVVVVTEPTGEPVAAQEQRRQPGQLPNLGWDGTCQRTLSQSKKNKNRSVVRASVSS